jgi:hypothetical protein
LPLDLNTYKFLGAQTKKSNYGVTQVENIAYSGPIKLDERESENFIAFEVKHPGSLVRFYLEMEGVHLTLEQLDSQPPKTLATGANGIARKLPVGKFRVKIAQASRHAKKQSSFIAPETYLTIAFADGPLDQEYTNTWMGVTDSCSVNANFPLALRQHKQADIHQLYYNYPVIKVDERILNSKQVL